VVDENGAALVLPREIFTRQVFLKLDAVGILRLKVFENLRPDEWESEPLVSLKAAFTCDKGSVLMNGDRVKETVALDAGAELIEVFDGGALPDLPIDNNLGDRELDNS